MKLTRITANLVGMMLFVQVILGGLATVLRFDVIYHIVWGVLTFAALIIANCARCKTVWFEIYSV